MSIKYAVLGLIAQEARHGYAVRSEFEKRLGDFWELNYGQVYQVLTALETEGAIAGTEQQVGRRPPRTVYAITAKGRDALRAWLVQPLSTSKPFREDFYVKLLFVDSESRGLLAQMLKTRLDACERRLAELLDQRHRCDRTDPKKLVRWLFAEAAILHAEADLKAAELCRDVMGNASRASADRPMETRHLSHRRG